jgi:nucleoside-diphosphate-sugar epimerase
VTGTLRISVAGSGGFIGGAVGSEAYRRGFDVVAIRSPRLHAAAEVSPTEALREWISEQQRAYGELVAELHGSDLLVNAAGLSAPTSRDVGSLYGANKMLPGLLATAAAEAGVRRLVHISSAAVQGRRDPLDETPATAPVTPYGDSKARGEAVLLERKVPVPPEVVVYRPTSVQGAARSVTRQLVRLASLPVIPSCARGEVPLPVALIENVAAGVVHVCAERANPEIVLQPWEGMTVRSLWRCFGGGRILNTPRPLARVGLGLLSAGGRLVPAASAVGRRLELIALGQAQRAGALADLGFIPPSGADGYTRLADEVRARLELEDGLGVR